MIKKQCQNCNAEFVIEEEDLSFYQKINVPPPTFCPECRMQRRMAWRNERSLYKRQCGLTGKEVITCFPPESGITVYDRDEWWSDKWDPFSFGRSYDFNKPFFIQFRELLSRIPMPSLFNSRCEQTPYANHVGEQKNGYLLFASWGGENLAYTNKTLFSKDSLDLLASRYCELGYQVVNSNKIYHSAFIENSENCTDSWFLFDCKGCTSCFGCVNLRNKSYHLFNEPLTKEEYRDRLREIKTGSYEELQKLEERFQKLKQRPPHRFANIFNSQNATGDNLSHVNNVKYSFDLEESRDSKFLVNGGMQMNEGYDGYGVGASAELLYEVIDTGDHGSRFFFVIFVRNGHDVQYSYACHGSHDLFGCIGLHKKAYCIFNKQYTKEEYEKLLPQIIAQMNSMPYRDAKGRMYPYGEFFPYELSPFAYNETIAQEYFPLSEQTASAHGFVWRKLEQKIHRAAIDAQDLPDAIEEADDAILDKVIGCVHHGNCVDQCTTAFKIIPRELQFYKTMHLPLPRLCPNCRHYERLRQRNPMKLWERSCTCAGTHSENDDYKNIASHFHGENPCPNEFQTSYHPDRPEIIYCETCYQQEVA